MSEVDYRTGPQKLFAAMRGELLGPVETPWPDGVGGKIKFWHRVLNSVESEQVITATGPRREEQGFSRELIIRALDENGNAIYNKGDLQMIRTQFPPDDVADICLAMRAQCDEVTIKVSDEALGNSSAPTPESGT